MNNLKPINSVLLFSASRIKGSINVMIKRDDFLLFGIHIGTEVLGN